MNKKRIDALERDGHLDRDTWITLLSSWNEDDRQYAADMARRISMAYFGNGIFVRGLIEFSNHCKNNCYYCGIRSGNKNVHRYRLTVEQILECCKNGYALGFRTFVLQGGEDPHYSDGLFVEIIRAIKGAYPDCALTLSLGEKSRESYARYYHAGADRYLLRHETAGCAHYKKLHPANMSLERRKSCLFYLKEVGYQLGCGFMVGSPYQNISDLADDMLFIEELSPQMVGIGPFLPHCATPFWEMAAGGLELTLFLLSLLRISLKNVLLPATTALGTLSPKGRELGIMAGANVVMPNLSPLPVRKSYLLYDNKISTDDDASTCMAGLEARINQIGYRMISSRGDWKSIERGNCNAV